VNGWPRVTRMIVESPSLLAREQQIFAGYTAALAALIADEVRAQADSALALLEHGLGTYGVR
jgi:hypothetical protein